MRNPVVFSGSVPGSYEKLLTPFLFAGFAADLMGKIDCTSVQNVLKLACGTGCVTSQLLVRLPPNVQLTATDLLKGMLDIAKAKIQNPNVLWKEADMTESHSMMIVSI